jgi:transcriptional regulator with XRE-family HTH domain
MEQIDYVCFRSGAFRQNSEIHVSGGLVMDETAIIATFAQKLKSLRLSNGLTLEELGAMSGVSISTISKIENHQQKPSFETVLRVARALHINFVQMLDGHGQANGAARRIVTRANDAPEYSNGAYEYEAHAAEITHKKMVPMVMRIRAREVPAAEQWTRHGGEEFIYVLDGSVEFHTQEYSAVILNKGDSCYLDSNMRHAFVSLGDVDATVLSVHISLVLPDGASEVPGNGGGTDRT